MSYRIVSASIIALTVLMLPFGAAADEDDDAYDEMLELSNIAADAVGEGNFELGAVKFRQAYDRYPDPVLLNNEMIAWYRADDCSNALVPAQTFLEIHETQDDEIDDADWRNVRTVMIECHLQLADQALDEGNPILADYHLEAISPMELDDDEQQRFTRVNDRLADHADSAATSDDGPATASPDDVSSLHLGWAQIAGGIALGGIGLSMHTVALNRQSQLEQLAAEDAAMFQQRRDDWSGYQNTARWMVPALYVVGAAAIGSGTYFLLGDHGTDSDVTVSPTTGPDQTGLSISGRF